MRNNYNNYQNPNQGGNNQQPRQQQPPKEREKYHFDIEPIPFDGTIESKITTTVDLAKKVNKIFRMIFSDYEACIILPTNNGALSLVLYFKDNNVRDERLKALMPAGMDSRSHSSAYSRIVNWNNRTRNKNYQLTVEAKEVLDEFVIRTRKGKVEWNKFMIEQVERQYPNYSIYVQLNCLDLNKIIRKIYGNKGPNGAYYQYQTSLIKPLGIVTGGGNAQNWMISIQQLNTKEVENLAKKVGMIPTAGNIPMVR